MMSSKDELDIRGRQIKVEKKRSPYKTKTIAQEMTRCWVSSGTKTGDFSPEQSGQRNQGDETRYGSGGADGSEMP